MKLRWRRIDEIDEIIGNAKLRLDNTPEDDDDGGGGDDDDDDEVFESEEAMVENWK